LSTDSYKLPVKVVPGASRSGIAGWLGDALRVRVSSPPEKGKANAAVESLIAEVLRLPAGTVKIVAGGASPRKIIAVSGLSEEEVRQRLATAVGQ